MSTHAQATTLKKCAQATRSSKTRSATHAQRYTQKRTQATHNPQKMCSSNALYLVQKIKLQSQALFRATFSSARVKSEVTICRWTLLTLW